MSQTHSLTPLNMGRLAISARFLFFVDQFGRSPWFCALEFNKIATSDGFKSHSRV